MVLRWGLTVKRHRKTKAEKHQERVNAEHMVWERFLPRLEALKTMEDAYQLVAEAPPPDAPGRRYYSNLGFFLQGFMPPMGSSYGEKGLYLQFIQRLDAARALKPGAREQVEKQLRDAMAQQGPW